MPNNFLVRLLSLLFSYRTEIVYLCFFCALDNSSWDKK